MKLDLNDPGLNLYLRVYNYYKDLICSGKMQPGTRLPSIRKCAMQLQLSRTTVETAYMLLAAEGYILSRPQSGYYVTEILNSGPREAWKPGGKETDGPKIRYDFASSNATASSSIYGGAILKVPSARMSAFYPTASLRERGSFGRLSAVIWAATGVWSALRSILWWGRVCRAFCISSVRW